MKLRLMIDLVEMCLHVEFFWGGDLIRAEIAGI